MYMIELALLRRKIQFETSFNNLIESYALIQHCCILKIGLQIKVNWVPDFLMPSGKLKSILFHKVNVFLDTITIYKKGKKLRIEYSLKGFKSYTKKNPDGTTRKSKNQKSSIIINPDWTKDDKLDMQTSIKLLNHDDKIYSSIFLDFNEEDINELAYGMARSSVFRVEKKYNLSEFSMVHDERGKTKTVNGYKCKEILFNVQVNKTA